MASLARLILLFLIAVIVYNAARGTLGDWFRAKFMGRVRESATQPSAYRSRVGPTGGRLV